MNWPERRDLPVERLDFARLARLDFEAPDPERFPALELARAAMTRGGVAPCVMNGSREVAQVAEFDRKVVQLSEIVTPMFQQLREKGLGAELRGRL